MVPPNRDGREGKGRTETSGQGHLAIAHRRNRRLVPMEVRPDVTAEPPTSLAGEQRFDIGEPDTIGPSVGADRGRMAATIIAAIDKQTAHAGIAHLAKGYFLRSAGEGGGHDRHSCATTWESIHTLAHS